MAERRTFDSVTLTHLRAMPVRHALDLLSLVFKSDPTYVPVKDAYSRRWHVSTVNAEFEILSTGIKWFDTRAQVGGGGAIDLTMHLLGISFVDAVRHLLARNVGHGPDPS